MKTAWLARLSDSWENVRNSYLLLPACMLVGGLACAVLMLYLDEILRRHNVQIPWVTTLTASAGRNILATLAGSMATIAGVVFSIDIVALQLAASQFGPHVMRGFLSDRGSQVSLGTFVGTFVYALAVLVSGRAQGGFVPYVAIYFGILLGFFAIGVLIYFINHIANLIRVESITASMAKSLAEATESVFPDHLGHGEPGRREQRDITISGRKLVAENAGYVRRISDSGLMRLATQNDLCVQLHIRPGDFVLPGTEIMTAGPVEHVDETIESGLRTVVVLGDRRTPYQDVGYAFQELAEIALRALSPGINAPFTAIPAIDAIAAGLVRLTNRRMPDPYREDDNGVVRVIVEREQSIAGLALRALGPIATAARDHTEVLARVIETSLLVADRALEAADRDALRRFADAVAKEAGTGLQTERDRDRVAEVYRAATRGAPGSRPVVP